MITPITKFSTTSTSFGSILRTVYDDRQRDKIRYKNNTWMFRYDLPWSKVADEISWDGIPKKIYCYACSDGSEPYSIAIALISKLGWDKAQQYFPIIARDVDEIMIKKAKCGILGLGIDDLEHIETYQKSSNVKFFEKIIKRTFPKIEESEYIGKVSDKLRNCVDFGVGDICQDARDFNYNNPSVIFFRNALPYLENEDRNRLLATFARNLNDKTSIVVGDFDKKALGIPLLNVQNYAFGLLETIPNFFTGKRLRDFPSIRCSSGSSYSDKYSYFDFLPKPYVININNHNKQVKSEIRKNNSKLKSINNNKRKFGEY